MSVVPDLAPGKDADPLVDEIRRVRRAISEQFGNDVDRLCEHLRAIERDSAARVVKGTDEAGQDER